MFLPKSWCSYGTKRKQQTKTKKTKKKKQKEITNDLIDSWWYYVNHVDDHVWNHPHSIINDAGNNQKNN